MLAVTLGAEPTTTPDVVVAIARGKETIAIGVKIESSSGPLASRQTTLLKDWILSVDGSGLLEGLVPEGKLLRAEVTAPSAHVESLTLAIFNALDANHDGEVSRDEAKNAANVLLVRFDADGDDCLTPLELVPDLLTREASKIQDLPKIEILIPGSTRAIPKLDALRTVRFDTPSSGVTDVRGYSIELLSQPSNPISMPETPKSLLRAGREKERERFESIAKEIVTLTVRQQLRGWFELLDADGDGQLSLRELRNAEKMLFRSEPDRGGLHAPDFAKATSVSLSVSPGAQTRPPVRLTKAKPPARGPKWFRALDCNGDGDLSRREFPGTDSQFRHYDADGDGLISAEEAEAGDRKLHQGGKP